MKWKFGLLRQVWLGLMSLLPIVMACKRGAPRNEPSPLCDQEDVTSPTIGPSCIRKESKSIANWSQPYASLWDNLSKDYKDDKDIIKLLKDIGYSEDLTLYHEQDQSSSNRLFIFFESNRKDGAWCEPMAGDPASTIIRSNPALPNSEKQPYSLIGFVADIQGSVKYPIVCVQTGQNWFMYNNDSKKTPLSTTDAMPLASKQGTTFFYRKIT